ncbi:MAG: hypothetical protein ACRCXH_14300 [Shewanella sp.]
MWLFIFILGVVVGQYVRVYVDSDGQAAVANAWKFASAKVENTLPLLWAKYVEPALPPAKE